MYKNFFYGTKQEKKKPKSSYLASNRPNYQPWREVGNSELYSNDITRMRMLNEVTRNVTGLEFAVSKKKTVACRFYQNELRASSKNS